MCAGCVAYIHAMINGVHTRVSAARDHTDVRVAEAKRDMEAEIAAERTERRREHDRLNDILEGFRAVGTAVGVMAEGVKNLGQRFDDQRASTDRALDEIKHGLREMSAKIPTGGTTSG